MAQTPRLPERMQRHNQRAVKMRLKTDYRRKPKHPKKGWDR